MDPFCGIGTVLWRVEQRARELTQPIRIAGVEINASVARLCSSLAALSDEGTQIHTADALQWLTANSADCVITQPPIGLSLPEPHELWGGATLEWEPLALARCVDALRPGGRAVVHTARSWLWREKAERFRQSLATTTRIVALVGLPEGLFIGTSIPSALIVLEKSPPTETLVADLRDDWYEQLSLGGATWERYTELVGQG